jgi:hypothetical protein
MSSPGAAVPHIPILHASSFHGGKFNVEPLADVTHPRKSDRRTFPRAKNADDIVIAPGVLGSAAVNCPVRDITSEKALCNPLFKAVLVGLTAVLLNLNDKAWVRPCCLSGRRRPSPQ